MAMILWGTLDAASDQTMATVTRHVGSEFREAVVELIGDVAAGIIADDPTLIAAAEAALEDAIPRMGIVDGEAVWEIPVGEGDDVAWGLIDHAEKRMPIEIDKAGHWSQHARDLIVEDTASRMGPAIGISTWPGELYGIGGEITDNTDKVLMRWDTRGRQVFPVTGDANTGGGGGQAAFPDFINEWWVESDDSLDTRDRLICSGISTGGRALVGEWVPGIPARSIDVGPAVVDDHAAAAYAVLGDGSLLATWTFHARDDLLRTTLGSPDGSVDSLSTGKRTDFDIGGSSSYTQNRVIRHLSDASKTVIWCFMRRDQFSWGYVPITVTHATRDIAFGPYVEVWDSGWRQTYITIADATIGGHQGLRVGAYYNPSVTEGGPIWTFEIDVETGAMSSVDSTLTGTLGTDVFTHAMTPALTALDTSQSRRLFYVGGGPSHWAIAYAEGSISAPDSWRYKIAEYIGGQWVVSDFGVAGPRIGFAATANYLGGMAFPAERHGRAPVVLARNSGSGATIEVFRHNGTEWVGKTLAQGDKFARPRFTQYGILYADIEHYGASYREYAATMRTAQEGR